MTEPTSTPHYCQAITRRGEPCKAYASASGFCPLHSENSHGLHVLGGQCRSNAHRLETRMSPTLRPIVDLLKRAAREVYSKEITPSQATALASVATALVKTVESAELQVQLDVLEKRLTEELERAKH